jgi:hypothetical protein
LVIGGARRRIELLLLIADSIGQSVAGARLNLSILTRSQIVDLSIRNPQSPNPQTTVFNPQSVSGR